MRCSCKTGLPVLVCKDCDAENCEQVSSAQHQVCFNIEVNGAKEIRSPVNSLSPEEP